MLMKKRKRPCDEEESNLQIKKFKINFSDSLDYWQSKQAVRIKDSVKPKAIPIIKLRNFIEEGQRKVFIYLRHGTLHNNDRINLSLK